MATVTLQAVKKNYGKVAVIHGIDVDIADQEFVVVVGPSGCGKSTLLRMVAGLETITEGDIQINNKRVNDLEPMDRNIAMVFQNYALYPHMSVFDNMAYSLKIASVSRDEIVERVNKAAKLLQLDELLDRKPRQLSGGQRQRVAMGRAIVRKPDVFLFDEPLSNLDAKLRVQMRLEIRKLQRDLGVTAIYVTHDQVEAMTLGDRLMVLNGGVVEQFGTPIELYEKPASLFVAEFIGSPSMNHMPATADGTTVTLSNGMQLQAATAASGKVIVGLRPEHLYASPSGTLTVATGMLEQLGSNTLVHGSLHNANNGLVFSLPGIHTEQSLGSSTQLGIEPNNVHLFDPASGRRL